MHIIRFDDRQFVPAGHEDPLDPGVWKKVLFAHPDLQSGRVQMINWARMPAGRHFANHYHEDMQEVFIILQGEAEITVAGETNVLRRGDAVRIEPRQTHRMRALGSEEVEYLALGISSGAGGRTILVDID